MSLMDRIEADLKQAVKSGDTTRRDLLRMIKARILEAEVALRSKHGRDYHLTDAETVEEIARYAKQRRQSIEAYRQGGREDLAAQEQRELDALQDYLPRQMSRAEIEDLVREAIAETGAASARDLGAVMRAAMSKAQGKADGKLVNEVARGMLG